MSRIARFWVVLPLALGIAASGLTEPLDLRLLDFQYRLLRAWYPRHGAAEVAVVGIDDQTVRAFREPIALWHAHLGRFLIALASARPAAVGIDLVLPERSFDGVMPGADEALARALAEARRSYPLVMAVTIGPDGRPRTLHRPFASIAGTDGWGYPIFPADRDGVVRRYDDRLGTGTEPVPMFVGQLARRLGIEPHTGLIDYSRGASFDYVPLHAVLEWFAAGDRPRLARAFEGKAVVLGSVLPYTDQHPAPVQLAAWSVAGTGVPGVLLHAQTLRNWLEGGLLRSVPQGVVLAAAGASTLLWFAAASVPLGLVVLCAAALLCLALATWLIAAGWVLPVGPILFAAALAVGLRIAAGMYESLAERRRLRASFSGYVSPSVMEEILAGSIRPDRDGELKFVCVMFADIRGYTSRGEKLRPAEVIRFLNRYFERVIGFIHERGGTVISIMGDGIMAVFGAPKPLENPCRSAFETAKQMLQFVRQLSIELQAEGDLPIEIGIGLNAGEALVCHVGAAARHEYSAIGDVTNVASRLQGMTKETGYPLLLSKAVADRLDASDALAPLGPRALKGHSAVKLFGYPVAVDPVVAIRGAAQ